jgi:hypothetical protein
MAFHPFYTVSPLSWRMRGPVCGGIGNFFQVHSFFHFLLLFADMFLSGTPSLMGLLA